MKGKNLRNRVSQLDHTLWVSPLLLGCASLAFSNRSAQDAPIFSSRVHGGGKQHCALQYSSKSWEKEGVCGVWQGTHEAGTGSSSATTSPEREAAKQEQPHTNRAKKPHHHRESITSDSNSPTQTRQKYPPLAKITAQEGLENYVPFWLGGKAEDSRQRGQRS